MEVTIGLGVLDLAFRIYLWPTWVSIEVHGIMYAPGPFGLAKTCGGYSRILFQHPESNSTGHHST